MYVGKYINEYEDVNPVTLGYIQRNLQAVKLHISTCALHCWLKTSLLPACNGNVTLNYS